MKFGEKIKSLRLNKKLTQDEVASAIGVSRRAYIAYEQENIRPRKQVTYDKLAKILGCDVNYLRIEDTVAGTAGMATALASLGTVLGAIGATTPVGMAAAVATLLGIKNVTKAYSSKEEKTEGVLSYSNDMLLQYEKHQKRFSVMALGVLYKAALEKGISCQQGNKKEINILGGGPDECIKVLNSSIKDWWLIFWSKDKKLDEHIIVFPEDRAATLISRFTTAKADPSRMASIVVDDLELFQAVLKFKGHNSYRGNMSVIFVDTEQVTVEREEIIATFSEKCEKDILKIK